MKHAWTVLAASLLLAFALAACGGDSQTGTDGNNANNGVTDDANTNNGANGSDNNGGLAGSQGSANSSVAGNGQSAANNGVTGSNNGQMPNGSSGSAANGQGTNGTANGNGTDNGGSLAKDAKDALDDVGDALTGGSPSKQSHTGSLIRGASFDQMVRNGRVHDRDGNLNDLENSVTPGVMF